MHRVNCRKAAKMLQPNDQMRWPYEFLLWVRLLISQLPADRFFNALVPFGCTLTVVLSRQTASTLILMIPSSCKPSNIHLRTPFLLQRFIRTYTVASSHKFSATLSICSRFPWHKVLHALFGDCSCSHSRVDVAITILLLELFFCYFHIPII